ncbi:hypothetical protein PYCCODRAFT_1422601 [Trametes coccinea BRFM310]|uniref:Uncharacterized protein n=1 Tax=Trametes coccinea (strain BRFM310) TaxID=1353009 RepID=A0A1Y2IYV3_TRAC3|nr:hypothetical protein PYCCODRAFT_1422601 [Trametes coccinea BRFM310]
MHYASSTGPIARVHQRSIKGSEEQSDHRSQQQMKPSQKVADSVRICAIESASLTIQGARGRALGKRYTGRRQAGLDVIKDAVISLSLASEGSSSYIVRSFQQSSVVSRFPALTIPPDPNISKSATGCKRGGSYDQTAQPCPRSPIEIPRQPSLVGPLEEKNNTSVDVLSAGSRPSCDAHVQRGSDTSQKEKLRRRMGVFHHEILHLQFLSAASDFLPGPFHRPPRNPAEKISSGYKCWEFLNWFYGLVSALLFNTLPRPYWVHICQLVAGVRIVFQRRSTASQRQRAHTLLSDLAYNYKGNLRQPKSSLAIHLLSSIPGNQALVRSMTGDDIAILKYIEANVGTSQAREDWLPNGQICRSAWKEVPNQMTRISRNVKYHADGEGEVQYYFRCPIGDKTETLALVSRYSLPNETLLNLSSGVVWACRAPGDSHRHLEQDACELPIGGAVAAAIPPGLPGQLSEAEAIQTADLAEKALIPVKKPFGPTARRYSKRLKATELGVPEVQEVPASRSDSLSANVPTGTVYMHVDDQAFTDGGGQGLTAAALSKSTTASGAGQGRLPQNRSQRSNATVLAKAEFKADMLSEQMIFMARMIIANPDVSHADYVQAFKDLSANEWEALKTQCARERKEVNLISSRHCMTAVTCMLWLGTG